MPRPLPLCWLILPPPAAALVSFLVVTTGFVVYDRVNERAAADVRARPA